MTFNDLNIIPAILKALSKENYITPTPIQEQAIPAVLAGSMLDMGFIHDVKKIITKMPSKRQTLFFSATMPHEISKMVKSLLVNPVKVEITPVSSTVDRIKQSIYLVDKENKKNQLNHLLQDKSITSALVFTCTKHCADRVVRELTKVKISAQAIQATNLKMPARMHLAISRVA